MLRRDSGFRCKIFSKLKLNLIVKRPKKYPKDYSIKPKTLGEAIRKHRMNPDSFQKDVAKFVGVTTDTVTNWEKGRVKPSLKNLDKITQFLK